LVFVMTTTLTDILVRVGEHCQRSDDHVVRAAGDALLRGHVTLSPTTGHPRWEAQVARAEFDNILRAYAQTFFPADTLAGRATSIHTHLAGYVRGDWLREKDREVCPHREGSERSYLWRLCRAQSAFAPVRPLSADRIGRILRNA
jgi:hypothetical protein